MLCVRVRVWLCVLAVFCLVCGCVGVWVCGCVGVWVCGCVGVWVCGCVGVWVCGSLQVMGLCPCDRTGEMGYYSLLSALISGPFLRLKQRLSQKCTKNMEFIRRFPFRYIL